MINGQARQDHWLLVVANVRVVTYVTDAVRWCLL